MSIPRLTLNNSKSIPILGLGTWKSPPGLVTQAVKDAIDSGYRHFDCAYVYQNEKEVGEALGETIKNGKVKREDLFITSKLWSTYHSKELVKPVLKESLENLKLDYLDLYLIHWPWGLQEGGELFPTNESGKRIYSNVDYLESWKAIEECYKDGLVHSIGLSNFNHEQIDRVLEICSIPPSVLQIECHPYLNQAKLINYCKEKGIVVTAFSPLGSPNRPWVAEGEPILMENPTIMSIAKNHGKSPAQILIRFQIQRGVAVIPKSTTKSRIESNFQVFDFELSTEEMKQIEDINTTTSIRYVEVATLKDHPYYPFNVEF